MTGTSRAFRSYGLRPFVHAWAAQHGNFVLFMHKLPSRMQRARAGSQKLSRMCPRLGGSCPVITRSRGHLLGQAPWWTTVMMKVVSWAYNSRKQVRRPDTLCIKCRITVAPTHAHCRWPIEPFAIAPKIP